MYDSIVTMGRFCWLPISLEETKVALRDYKEVEAPRSMINGKILKMKFNFEPGPSPSIFSFTERVHARLQNLLLIIEQNHDN